MRRWIGGIAAMATLTALITLFARVAAPEAGKRMLEAPVAFPAGWGLALANAARGYAVNRRALRGQGRDFVRWAVGANVLRMLLLLAIMAAFLGARFRGGEAFLTAIFSGYFVFLALEVLDLHKIGSGRT